MIDPSSPLDPLDYSRAVLREHACRAAEYADCLSRMAEMRDDESAVCILRRLVYEVRSASEAVKLLQAEHARRSGYQAPELLAPAEIAAA